MACSAVTSVNAVPSASRDYRIDAPRSGASEHEVQEEKTVENGRSAPVHGWPERHRKRDLEISDSHLSRQHERDRARQQSKRERAAEIGLQNPRQMKLPHWWGHRHRRNRRRERRKTKQFHRSGHEENEPSNNSQDAQHPVSPRRSRSFKNRH